MALVNQPPILASSFAVNGDKNTIPATNSGTEGLASLSLGFPPITQQPVSQGGIPPQRADFNGIFNLITNFLMFIQNGSIFAYSSSLDYQPPAIVYGNNALYRCVATNGANTSAGVQPLSNTTYWKPLIPVGDITISGNVITITNETGAQIQYTIDTINNPPAQSDNSNKIVTSAWVKAYAPSKTGSGASGTWGITANKAISDKNGLQIDTGYLKRTGGDVSGNIYLTGTNFLRIKTGGDNDNAGCGFSINNSSKTASIRDWSLGQDVIGYTAGDTYATTNTPPNNDNSTKLATTAFVKSLFTASKATNGWHKEASTGFIWQWGEEANYHDIMDDSYGSSGSLNFPISFPNKCLAVMPYLIGRKTFCCVSVSSFTNAKITVHWDEWSHDVQSVKFGYIAVGY